MMAFKGRGQKFISKSHEHAPSQEKEWAEKLDGKQVKASGAGTIKGDVRIKGILRLENKCTKHKSFAITRDMIQKIENAAILAGEVPAIQVDFLDSMGRVEHQLAVVPAYVLANITEGFRDLYESS